MMVFTLAAGILGMALCAGALAALLMWRGD